MIKISKSYNLQFHKLLKKGINLFKDQKLFLLRKNNLNKILLLITLKKLILSLNN